MKYKDVSLNKLNRKITIIKRDGRKEPFSKKKLWNVCIWAADGNETIAEDLIKSTEVKLKEEIHIKDMYHSLKETASSKISTLTPIYDKVAAKLTLLDLYREAYNIKNKQYTHLKDIIKKGVAYGVYDKDIATAYTDQELETLNEAIVQERDYLFGWNGLNQFSSKYCLNYSKTRKLELPQHTYMRVAMGLTYNEDDRIERAIRLYNVLSLHLATFGTPIMLGAFTPYFQSASCVLSTIGNDTFDIMNKLMTSGLYTKGAGGLAFDVTLIQAKGSYTRKGVKASGIVPYIQNIQAVVKSMMQGDNRRGMAVISCHWWHYEIEDFLVLKDNGGTHETRAEGLKYAFVTNKFFMDAVESNKDVYLFDPLDAEDLYWAETDEEFEAVYNSLVERKGIRRKKINARDLNKLYNRIYFQTGNVYETRLSNINPNMTGRKVNSSNLCVSGDTEIYIKLGDRQRNPIKVKVKDLGVILDNVLNVKVLSFNTCTRELEWNKIMNFGLTGQNEKVIDITYKKPHTGREYTITLTPNHPIWSETQRSWKMAMNLHVGNKLIGCYKGSDSINLKFGINFTKHEQYIVTKVEDHNKTIPVYDITVDSVHNFIANDILIHNCQEIVEPSRPGKFVKESIITEDGNTTVHTIFKDEEIALCNLMSLNLKIFLPEWIEKIPEMTGMDLEEVIYTVYRALDNTIDISQYPRASAKKSNLDNRFIGVGCSNYAYYLAKKKVKFSSKEAQIETYKLFQDFNYYVMKANTRLAKEKGTPPNYNITLHNKDVHVYDLANSELKKRFERYFDEGKYIEIKNRVRENGVRNILCMAIAPTASSGTAISVIQSIEPILNYSYLVDGAISGRVVVPDFQELHEYYEKAYDIPQEAIIILAAIRQMWLDQSQSVNLYIKEENWNYQYLMKLQMLAYKLGVKTSYYLNSPKQDPEKICDSCGV